MEKRIARANVKHLDEVTLMFVVLCYFFTFVSHSVLTI